MRESPISPQPSSSANSRLRNKPEHRLMLITNRTRALLPLEQVIERACDAGVSLVQLREKI
jgi:thiamine monophosphate synthase